MVTHNLFFMAICAEEGLDGVLRLGSGQRGVVTKLEVSLFRPQHINHKPKKRGIRRNKTNNGQNYNEFCYLKNKQVATAIKQHHRTHRTRVYMNIMVFYGHRV